MAIRHLTVALLAVATTATIFPVSALAVCEVRDSNVCLDARVQNNGESIDDRAGETRFNRRMTAIGLAAAGHHFRVDEHAPAQASFSVGAFESEHAFSLAIGKPMERGFGSIQIGASGPEIAGSASFTFELK